MATESINFDDDDLGPATDFADSVFVTEFDSDTISADLMAEFTESAKNHRQVDLLDLEPGAYDNINLRD